MIEHRSGGTRCPICAQTAVHSITGTRIDLTCVQCGHTWPEAREQPTLQWVAPTDDAVHQAVTAICQARDLESLMQLTRRAAREFTGADGVSFILRAGDSCYYADEDAVTPLWKGQRFPLESCVSGWAMRHRQSILIPDIYVDDRVPHDSYRPTFVRSLLMVPVRKANPIAAIGAYWRMRAAPTERHVVVVELLAEAVSVGLAREQTWTRVQDWLHTRGPLN